MPDGERERDQQRSGEGKEDTTESGRPRLSAREVLRLIFRTYWESLPYLIIFLAGLLLATWIVTELVF